jgi:hypothetical protein
MERHHQLATAFQTLSPTHGHNCSLPDLSPKMRSDFRCADLAQEI